jgi:hypothetical protein
MGLAREQFATDVNPLVKLQVGDGNSNPRQIRASDL